MVRAAAAAEELPSAELVDIEDTLIAPHIERQLTLPDGFRHPTLEPLLGICERAWHL
jgi:hypothetical protein